MLLFFSNQLLIDISSKYLSSLWQFLHRKHVPFYSSYESIIMQIIFGYLFKGTIIWITDEHFNSVESRTTIKVYLNDLVLILNLNQRKQTNCTIKTLVTCVTLILIIFSVLHSFTTLKIHSGSASKFQNTFLFLVLYRKCCGSWKTLKKRKQLHGIGVSKTQPPLCQKRCS